MNINLAEIDAIIFDLGGVIIEVDMEAPYRELLARSNLNPDNLLANLKQIAYQYEIGKINNNEFIYQIQTVIDFDLSAQQITNLWNQMLGNVPSYLGSLLTKIKQEKRTFVLSNTNSIHIQEFKIRFEKSIPQYPLESLFEKIYYSYEIGLHKPDLEIYQYVIKDAQLNPQKTLFIDDNKANVEGAKKAGLQAIHANPPMNLNRLLAEES